MRLLIRFTRLILFLGILGSSVRPAYAQIDFSGVWAPIFHEDQPERVPGPDVGDYAGLPINDAARLKADTWDASLLTLLEHQCKPHPSTYGFRGVGNLRIAQISTMSRSGWSRSTHRFNGWIRTARSGWTAVRIRQITPRIRGRDFRPA